MNLSSCSGSRKTLNSEAELFAVIRDGTPGEYMARCPAHDDSNPSLSLTVKGDGKILWHCFAGCSQEAVQEALGLGSKYATDPHSSFFKKPASYGELRQNGRCAVLDPEAILQDAMALTPGDIPGAEAIVRRSLVSNSERAKETLVATFAAGVALSSIKKHTGHGQFGTSLDTIGLNTDGDKRWARRAMALTHIENVLGYPSVTAALASKPKKNRKNAQKTKMEALEAENEALVEFIEKMSRPPSDSELQGKVNELEREKRVLLNRNSKLSQTVRKLEDKISCLEDEVESYREREAIQAADK